VAGGDFIQGTPRTAILPGIGINPRQIVAFSTYIEGIAQAV